MFEPDRLPDWPERLEAAVAHHRDMPFAWGRYDCGTLFEAVTRAVTGTTPVTGLGMWATRRSAMRLLLRQDASSVREALDRVLPRIHPSQARRGDAGYAPNSEPLCCPAIIVGAEAVSRDEHGWMVFPVSLLTTCYRIGR